MRLRLMLSLFLATILIAACQGPPPTQVIMVVTEVVVVTPTPDSANDESPEAVDSEATAEAAAEATDSPATPTSLPATATPDPFPTPVLAQISVAEQRFENGRMFWLQPVDQIWVMTVDENDDQVWSIYDDDFIEGEPEIDPSIDVPDGFYQPERGFGQLWRDNPEVRQALGWAIEPEFGHVTRYEYHAGGTVTNNEYVPSPGYHIVGSLYGDVVRFNEGEWSWQLVRE